MSLFRAITAEEEAASALMLALRQQNYPGASRLNPKDHRHKSAIWPFLQAIGRGVREKGVVIPQMAISTQGEPRLELSIDISEAAGQPLWATPDHPFNFVMHSDEKGPFEVHRWERELLAIASDKGFSDIRSHIAAEANLRNRILYSSHEGIPAVTFADDLLRTRLDHVTWVLVVTIGIVQTPEHQLFVVQGLEALLRALEQFEGEGYSFPAHGPPTSGPYLSLVEQSDGSMKLKMVAPQLEWPMSPSALMPSERSIRPRSINVTFGR